MLLLVSVAFAGITTHPRFDDQGQDETEEPGKNPKAPIDDYVFIAFGLIAGYGIYIIRKKRYE